MKHFALPVLVALGLLSLGACRDEETTPVEDDPTADGGTRADSSTKLDGAVKPTEDGSTPRTDSGTDGGTVGARQLTAGEIEILSTLADGTIVFQRYGTKVSLEAIAPAGGTPTVIVPDLKIEGEATDDVVSVIGGVVGIWTGVDGDTELGKLSIWSKANGLKEAALVSPIFEVDGTNDGARVAFVRQVGAGASATLELVTGPSTLAANSPVVVQANLGDGSDTNPCFAFYTFVAQNLFTSTCTGNVITATARRTNAAGEILQIDTGLAPGFLSMNGTGDKVFSAKRITAGGTGGDAAVYTLGATAVTELAIEAAGVAEGVISTDGSQVVYRTRLGALKKAAAVAPANPTELVANSGLLGILGVAPDFKTVMSHKLAPGGQFGTLFDLQLSATAAAGVPVTLVPTATAIDFGFTLGSKYALWVPNPAAATLKAKPVAAGAEVDLGAIAVFLGKIDGTDKVVVGDNQREITVDGRQVDVVDFKTLDPAAPTASVSLTKGAEIGALVAPGGKQIVYTEAAKGLFIRDIP